MPETLAGYERWRTRAIQAEELAGEALCRARLALTALALDSPGEAGDILAALCGLLVEAGAVDPLEDEAS